MGYFFSFFIRGQILRCFFSSSRLFCLRHTLHVVLVIMGWIELVVVIVVVDVVAVVVDLISHLLFPWRLDFFFLIFRLKKQQHLVSSTTSTSVPGCMGALDLSAVAPSSSPARERSILVDPRTTWTEGCRFSLVNRGPRPSMPEGLDSDQAAFLLAPVTPPPPPSFWPVRCRSRPPGDITSWLAWRLPTGVLMLRPVQSNSPSST